MTAKRSSFQKKLINLTGEQVAWVRWQAERQGCFEVDVIRKLINDGMMIDPLPTHLDPERAIPCSTADAS